MTQQTLVFAHRGANREAAENTRTAFDRALAYPIDGIETDIQLSRDEVAVLWHDRDLKKLQLPGKRIDDFDYAQLREMDFAAHFREASPLPLAGEGANEALRAMPSHEGVMSLQEFVGAYRARCQLLLEIKNRDWEPRERHELKVRRTLALAAPVTEDRILASSFDLDSLIYAHGFAPAFPLVLNLEPEQNVNHARRILNDHPFLYGLCVHVSTLDADMMALVRERGKRIAVYTCNSESEIDRALTLGVDILISDLPQKALQMRDK